MNLVDDRDRRIPTGPAVAAGAALARTRAGKPIPRGARYGAEARNARGILMEVERRRANGHVRQRVDVLQHGQDARQAVAPGRQPKSDVRNGGAHGFDHAPVVWVNYVPGVVPPKPRLATSLALSFAGTCCPHDRGRHDVNPGVFALFGAEALEQPFAARRLRLPDGLVAVAAAAAHQRTGDM